MSIRLAFLALICLGATQAFAEAQVSTFAVLRATAGMSVSADGSIYIADFGDANTVAGRSLYRLDADGSSTLISNALAGPSGNMIDVDGSLLQSEYRRNRVVRVSSTGSITPIATVPSPDDLATDSAGNLYVASCSYSGGLPGVYRIDSGVASAVATSASYGCVPGLTFDDQDLLYFSSYTTARVYRRGADGTVSVFATLPAGGSHIKFANDRFYVVVPERNQIMTISRSGTVSVLAGTGAAGTVDGAASQARFNSPFHIELSPDHRYLFVSGGPNGDVQDNPVRLIDLFPERGSPIGPSTTGAWYDPEQAGHGLFVEALPDNRLLAWWFSFDADGNQSWFGGVGDYAANVATVPFTQTAGGRFIPNFDPTQVTNPIWGTVTLTFNSCHSGRVDFSSQVAGYDSGSMQLTRLTLPLGLACAPFQ